MSGEGTRLQRLAAAVSERLGRETPLIRLFRPVYGALLDVVSGGRGYRRTLNGHEQVYIHPVYRGYIPEDYEPGVAAFLRPRVKPGDVCLDVGAHVGVYALCFATWAGATGRVYAFEPNPETRRVLVDHVRRNRMGDRITVRPDAVSDEPGEATLHVSAIEGTNRLGAPNPDVHAAHKTVTVPVTTVDHVVSADGLDPDWLFLDIEGFEVRALRGAANTIRRGRVNVVVEFHPALWESAGTSRVEFQALLSELGLSPVPLTGQRDVWGEPGVVHLARAQAPAA